MELTKGEYSIPDEEVFIKNVRACFSGPIEKLGYRQTNVINKEMHVVITYENNQIKRRIEISNQTHPSDYGFSIFIYNTINDEHNIAVNVPWNNEDKECRFVERSA